MALLFCFHLASSFLFLISRDSRFHHSVPCLTSTLTISSNPDPTTKSWHNPKNPSCWDGTNLSFWTTYCKKWNRSCNKDVWKDKESNGADQMVLSPVYYFQEILVNIHNKIKKKLLSFQQKKDAMTWTLWILKRTMMSEKIKTKKGIMGLKAYQMPNRWR